MLKWHWFVIIFLPGMLSCCVWLCGWSFVYERGWFGGVLRFQQQWKLLQICHSCWGDWLCGVSYLPGEGCPLQCCGFHWEFQCKYKFCNGMYCTCMCVIACVYVCCVCVYLCGCACVCVYLCVCACGVLVCVYVRVFVCTCMCLYGCVHTHIASAYFLNGRQRAVSMQGFIFHIRIWTRCRFYLITYC